jgi:peptidoglycan hydrolase-like protein with peptidoglycan-binding domain
MTRPPIEPHTTMREQTQLPRPIHRPPVLYLTSPSMRGEEVRKVQAAPNTHGFANSRDSVDGPFTEALIKKFQASQELKVDGVVGSQLTLLLGYRNGKR